MHVSAHMVNVYVLMSKETEESSESAGSESGLIGAMDGEEVDRSLTAHLTAHRHR